MEFSKYIDAGLPILGGLLALGVLIYIIGLVNLVIAVSAIILMGFLITALSYILGWISINVVHRSKR